MVIAFVWGYFLSHYVPFFTEIHNEDEFFRLFSQLYRQNDVRFGLMLPTAWVMFYPTLSAIMAAVAAGSGKVSRFWWAIPFFSLRAN